MAASRMAARAATPLRTVQIHSSQCHRAIDDMTSSLLSRTGWGMKRMIPSRPIPEGNHDASGPLAGGRGEMYVFLHFGTRAWLRIDPNGQNKPESFTGWRETGRLSMAGTSAP